jgi:hypothetical protein
MTDEPIPGLAEAMAEIRRLRAEVDKLRDEKVELCIEGYQRDTLTIKEGTVGFMNYISELTSDNRRLRERIAELETHAAMTFGTLAQPTEDAPAVITHGHAPSAPPHDE